MNHQITLEELGLIPEQEPPKSIEQHINYACPCGGCICNHCANSTEFACFICDDCKWYDGKGTDNRRTECKNYKITEAYANAKRKKFKVLKPGSEG